MALILDCPRQRSHHISHATNLQPVNQEFSVRHMLVVAPSCAPLHRPAILDSADTFRLTLQEAWGGALAA